MTSRWQQAPAVDQSEQPLRWQQAQPVDGGEPGMLQGAVDAARDFSNQFVSQGVLMGHGDELFAAATTPIEMGIRAYTGEDAGKGLGERISSAYGSAVEGARSRDRAAQERSPIASTAGELAGAVTTGGTALRAGASLIPRVAGAGLPTRVGAGIVEGTGWGGLHGTGTGEGEDKISSGLRGGATGALAGGLAPTIASGAGKAAKWGMKGWQNLASRIGLGKMPAEQRKAATRILRDLEDSGMSVDDAAKRLDELGPEGMIADVSPTMQQRTGQLAARDPGTSRAVTGALKQRREAGRGRVSQSLDNAFGPAKDPYAVRQGVRDASTVAAPEYKVAHNAKFDSVPAIKELARRINQARGPVRTQLNRVLKMFDDPKNATGLEAHQIREALDDMTDSIFSGRGESSMGMRAGRQLSDFRKFLDAEMKKQIPAFRDADRVVADAKRMQGGFEYGRQELLRGGPSTQSPGQAAARLRSMSGPERQSTRQGARFELERQTSNQRRNPALTAESALTRDFNDDKTRLLLGRQPSSRLGKNLEREKTFLETSNLAEAGRGSRTGMIQPQGSQTTGDAIDVAGPAIVSGMAGPMAGAATFGAQLTARLARNGLSAMARRAENAIGRAQGTMQTARGPERDAVVRELRNLAFQIRKAGDVESATEMLALATTVQQGHRAEPLMPAGVLP